MPALLKAFFEQIFRPGFAIPETGVGTMLYRLLKGRSARVVVTMGVPALVYTWYFWRAQPQVPQPQFAEPNRN